MTGPLPSDDYLERIRRAEEMLAEAEHVHEHMPEAVLTHRMDQLRAASQQTRSELLERAAEMSAPHQIDFGNDERRMILLLAGMLDTRRCKHFEKTPAMPGLLVMCTRTQLCHDCADRAHRNPFRRPPVVVPNHVCDLCLGHPVDEFSSITVQLGPVLMVGDVCSACIDRLEMA